MATSVTIEKLGPRRTKSSVLFKELCDTLREQVLQVRPGAELREIELSKMFGVSRTPVRESLIQLANEGLVQFQPNGRCQVTELTIQDIVEMSDIRGALEGIAARSLCGKLSDEQIASLRETARFIDEGMKSGVSKAELDCKEVEFHRKILQLARNQKVLEILDRQGLLVRLLTAHAPGWTQHEDSVPFHTQLVEALATGTPVACEQLFRDHIESTKNYYVGLFKAKQAQSASRLREGQS